MWGFFFVDFFLPVVVVGSGGCVVLSGWSNKMKQKEIYFGLTGVCFLYSGFIFPEVC